MKDSELTCGGCRHLSNKKVCMLSGLNIPDSMERSEECKRKKNKALGIVRMDIMSATNNPMRVIYIMASVDYPNHPVRSSKPIVEFYDSRYDHTPDGQFITRYDQGTFESIIDSGLDLSTGIPDWKIHLNTVKTIQNWIRYQNNYIKGMPHGL